MTIQNIYQLRKVGAISQFMLQQAKQQQMREVKAYHIDNAKRIRCGVAQMMVIPVLIGLTILQWLAPFLATITLREVRVTACFALWEFRSVYMCLA